MEKVTLTLPKELMDKIRQNTPPRGHSKFVADALQFYIEENRRRALRERLRVGYQANAALDAALADEWAAVEEESWLRHVPAFDAPEEPTHDAAIDPAR
jgi:metal-responsive CopG/Arc/MetJ family transcriptional regulator